MTNDDLVFTAVYPKVEAFKRYYHTFESYARAAGFEEIKHELETGEVLKETRLDAVSS